MAAISKLMKRLGYVQLDRYGLVLTGDDRILATRPVLDDGLGGRIVGWADGDLAAMELDTYGTPKARPPTIIAKPAPLPAVATVVATPARRPSRPSVPLVASELSELSEDDWEWTIAVARARAVADELELDFASATEVTPAPLEDDDADWAAIRARAEVAAQFATIPTPTVPRPAPLPPTPRRTVIPVPALPTMAGVVRSISRESNFVQPVVASGSGPVRPPVALARTRFPKGTDAPGVVAVRAPLSLPLLPAMPSLPSVLRGLPKRAQT
ncbi:MAG: hypothetical protein NT062_20430 [Proteobacteria bacterium]|nr:hypothetical protein [Pseudomonadota bacterium]